MNKIVQITPRSLKCYNRLATLRFYCDEQIMIPKRIHRSPTDILRALESTINHDSTATHYKYHDDPFLIPHSNLAKRTYALSHESGRKAAHWVREQHPDLFQHRVADPVISSFLPKPLIDDEHCTEKDLKYAIKESYVNDAVRLHELLKNKGVTLEAQTIQDLLDLLCFYNNEDGLSPEFIEERWYRQTSRGRERNRKTWNDGALAEELFIALENPSGEAYSALIQGMAKYYQVERAKQLFDEANEKKLPLTIGAYNALLRIAHFLKENVEMRWSFITSMLIQINERGIAPNLGTLNAALEALTTMGSSKACRDNALKMLREFKAIGIEPSLASWYFILITFCKERGPVSYILKDILPFIENQEHTIKDVKDTYFFVTAMDVCRNHLNDRELGERVHNLLLHKNNYDLIGDSFKESVYYRHFFILMCENEPLDRFMTNVYEKLVPNIYIPEPSVMFELLKSIQMNSAVEYLPKIWSDLVVFDQTDRENLLNLLLNIIIDHKPEANDVEMLQSYENIAWSIWTKINSQNVNKTNKLAFEGEMLGNIMLITLWNGEFEKAVQIMNKLDKDVHEVVGVPNVNAMEAFIQACIQAKAPSRALQCVEYCIDCGFPEAERLAKQISEAMTLSEEHSHKLCKLFSEKSV